MTSSIAAAAILAIALLYPPSGCAQDKVTITPGKGLSFAAIGDTGAAFVQATGPKTQATKVPVGKDVQILLDAAGFGVTAVCPVPAQGSDLRIAAIIVTNPAFVIEGNGLHVGSQEAEVLRLMQVPPELDVRVSGYRIIGYPELGIIFSIAKAVTSITVLAPGDTKTYQDYAGVLGFGMSKSEMLYGTGSLK